MLQRSLKLTTINVAFYSYDGVLTRLQPRPNNAKKWAEWWLSNQPVAYLGCITYTMAITVGKAF